MDNSKLDAAIYKAGQVAPFLRMALASCHMVICDQTVSNGQPTTACDPFWRVYVHPNIVEFEPVTTITHMLLHEVSHLVRRHHKRMEGRPQMKANVAGDCEIESHSWPGLTKPKFGVSPSKYKLDNGLTAEAYFEKLPNFDDEDFGNLPGGGRPSDCGSGASGAVRPWDLPRSAAPIVNGTKAEAIAQQTAEAIQRNGRGAGHAWMQWSAEQLKPTITWKQFIRQWINSSRVKQGSGKLSSRNPRIKHGVIRRGWVGKKVRLNVVCDTSGSMGGKPIALALAEVLGICNAAIVSVWWQDDGGEPTVQHGVRRWEDLKPIGGGGTDLRPAIAMAAADEPDGVIVITDCDTPWEPNPPSVPTLVVRVVSQYSTSAPPPSWETLTIK